jgi:predicted metal-binding membrane protein
MATRLAPRDKGLVSPRKNWLLTATLTLLCSLSWLWLWRMEMGMPGMAQAVYTQAWTLSFGIMIAEMWLVMMAAMMIPLAMPMLRLFAGLRASGKGSALRTTAFASGYMLIWTGFSLLATALQWLLSILAVEHGANLKSASLFTAAVLVVSGVYQWSPFKQACLKHCQTPLGFLLSHWEDGRLGALRMGLAHGLFCLGCCWLLMALMLVGGGMNLLLMTGITLYLLLERNLPFGLPAQKLSGSLLLATGLAWMAQQLAFP